MPRRKKAFAQSALTVNYNAHPTCAEFHRSDAKVRFLIGPWGSGKSSACVIELFRRAMAQHPSPDGVRRTRWAIIRNTYPELKSTTLKTFMNWFPPSQFGEVKMDIPITYLMQLPLKDGTRMDLISLPYIW